MSIGSYIGSPPTPMSDACTRSYCCYSILGCELRNPLTRLCARIRLTWTTCSSPSHSKPNKQRVIPMSLELRKRLFRHLQKNEYSLVFCTRDGSRLSKD